MAEPEAATIPFAPNPELAIDEQRRVEEPTGNANLHEKSFWGAIKKWLADAATWGWRESEGGLGDDEIGDWGWVEPDLFDAAAKLARGTSAPGENLQGYGVVLVVFWFVQEGEFG